MVMVSPRTFGPSVSADLLLGWQPTMARADTSPHTAAGMALITAQPRAVMNCERTIISITDLRAGSQFYDQESPGLSNHGQHPYSPTGFTRRPERCGGML